MGGGGFSLHGLIKEEIYDVCVRLNKHAGVEGHMLTRPGDRLDPFFRTNCNGTPTDPTPRVEDRL